MQKKYQTLYILNIRVAATKSQNPKHFKPIYQLSLKKNIYIPKLYLEYLEKSPPQKKTQPTQKNPMQFFFKIFPPKQPKQDIHPTPREASLALEVNAADSVGFLKGCPPSVEEGRGFRSRDVMENTNPPKPKLPQLSIGKNLFKLP